MSNVYDNLKVQVSEDGKIINIEELIETIRNLDMNDDLATFLYNLNNKIDNSEFENKEELTSVIKRKLLEHESIKETTNKSNLESLKLMQDINSDLNKLGIISTKKETNDSNKDIDYLTYVDENGYVEVLVCEGYNTLNEYIQAHADVIANYSAKDIFKHFKEHVHRNLEFEEPHELDEDKLNEAEVREKETVRQEYEEIVDYCKRYSIDEKVEMCVDPNGERIYRVKDGIFKFKSENGLRVMQVLQMPEIKQIDTNEIMNDLEQEEMALQTVSEETIDEQKPDEIQENDVQDVENANEYTYETLPQQEITSSNLEKAKEIIQKRDVYETTLSTSEILFIDSFTKELIESMVQRAGNANDSYQLFLDDVMRENIDKYNDIKEGIIDKNALSELEYKQCEQYMKYNSIIMERNLNLKQNKKLELKNDHSNSGVTTIVMLLEIMLLAMFIILFSSIDI